MMNNTKPNLHIKSYIDESSVSPAHVDPSPCCDVVPIVPSECKQNGRIVGDGRFISHLRRGSAFGIKKKSTGGAEDRFFTTMNKT